MKRVLVCSPERHIGRLVQVNMERQGHVATVVVDGKDAVALLTQEHFDIVVLDPDLSDPSALEVADWIGTQDSMAPTEILVLGTPGH